MTEIGGIRAQDAYLLTDPTSKDLELQFEHLRSRIAAGNGGYPPHEIVVYYSGHSDESGLMLGDDHLSYVELRRLIDDVGADVSIAILDSCASGAFTRLKGGSFTQPFLLDEGSDVTGHAFLASSSADEASQESDSLGSSFFTHYLVSGLRGAADSSDDRVVTLDEVYLYAREKNASADAEYVRRSTERQLRLPADRHRQPVLTDLSVVDAAIVLDESVAGRLFVSREIGGIVAEVEKREGNDLTLALPAGSYVLTLQGDGPKLRARSSSHLRLERSSRGARFPHHLPRPQPRSRQRRPSVAPLSLTVVPGVELVAEDPYEVTYLARAHRRRLVPRARRTGVRDPQHHQRGPDRRPARGSREHRRGERDRRPALRGLQHRQRGRIRAPERGRLQPDRRTRRTRSERGRVQRFHRGLQRSPIRRGLQRHRRYAERGTTLRGLQPRPRGERRPDQPRQRGRRRERRSGGPGQHWQAGRRYPDRSGQHLRRDVRRADRSRLGCRARDPRRQHLVGRRRPDVGRRPERKQYLLHARLRRG